MNLARIKSLIRSKCGQKYRFRYRGARNQIEEFDGIIKKCYSSIFLIELEDKQIRTFSYNDFITNNIKILS